MLLLTAEVTSDRSGSSVVVSTRVPLTDRAFIGALAEVEQLSVSEVVHRILMQGVRARLTELVQNNSTNGETTRPESAWSHHRPSEEPHDRKKHRNPTGTTPAGRQSSPPGVEEAVPRC